MSIRYRAAVSADTDAICLIAERAWETAHEPIIGPAAVESFLDAHYDEDAIRSAIEDDGINFLVAETADDIVAFGQVHPTADGDGRFSLSRLYVRPERWREGIGFELLSRLERTVDRRGGERIELGVMAENERAIRFYEAAGYRRVDEFHDDRIDTTGYTYEKSL